MAWAFRLFCAVSAKNHGLASNLLGFSRFRALIFDLVLVLRSQFFEYLREKLYKHALDNLNAARPEKKRSLFSPFFFPSYGKCLTTTDLFQGL